MFDFDTAVQTVLSPAFTLSVIVVLVGLVLLQWLVFGRRLSKVHHGHHRFIATLVATLADTATQEIQRRERRAADKAIEYTYSTLKNVGWDKLARGDVTIEDFIYGTPSRDDKVRQNTEFSLDELYEALRPGGGTGGKLNGSDDNAAAKRADAQRKSADVEPGPKAEGRPFHFTGGSRSPRAG